MSDEIKFTSTIEAPAGELRDWHFRDGAFGRLTPPWENAEVVDYDGVLKDGAKAVIETKIGPITQRWVAVHEITDTGFIDRQESGPFASWEHHHSFNEVDATASRLTDAITYALPMGWLGKTFGGGFVKGKLDRMFRYRHDTTKLDLERNAKHPPKKSMAVMITGATGMVGTALTAYLKTQGHSVLRVTRTPKEEGDIRWDLKKGEMDLPEEVMVDAVIHLAGENIAGGRWTNEMKERLMESRRLGTRLVAETFAKRDQKPEVIISASGANYYEVDGTERTESSPLGDGFLSKVCEVWESEMDPAREAGIRVVHPRIGVVLSPAGGALGKLLPLFQLGLGGPVGDGKQHLSWIAIDDLIDFMHRCLSEPSWEGPVNLTASESISSREFGKVLGKVLGRPAVLPAPAMALKAVFGEMAEATLLGDVRVVPEKLQTWGYDYRYSNLEAALRHLLGRQRS